MVRRAMLVVVPVQSPCDSALGTTCVTGVRMVFQMQSDHGGSQPGMNHRADDEERDPFPAPGHGLQYGGRPKGGQTWSGRGLAGDQ